MGSTPCPSEPVVLRRNYPGITQSRIRERCSDNMPFPVGCLLSYPCLGLGEVTKMGKGSNPQISVAPRLVRIERNLLTAERSLGDVLVRDRDRRSLLRHRQGPGAFRRHIRAARVHGACPLGAGLASMRWQSHWRSRLSVDTASPLGARLPPDPHSPLRIPGAVPGSGCASWLAMGIAS